MQKSYCLTPFRHSSYSGPGGPTGRWPYNASRCGTKVSSTSSKFSGIWNSKTQLFIFTGVIQNNGESGLSWKGRGQFPPTILKACTVDFSVAINRVATYRELDHDLHKHAAFLTLVRGRRSASWSYVLSSSSWGTPLASLPQDPPPLTWLDHMWSRDGVGTQPSCWVSENLNLPHCLWKRRQVVLELWTSGCGLTGPLVPPSPPPHRCHLPTASHPPPPWTCHPHPHPYRSAWWMVAARYFMAKSLVRSYHSEWSPISLVSCPWIPSPPEPGPPFLAMVFDRWSVWIQCHLAFWFHTFPFNQNCFDQVAGQYSFQNGAFFVSAWDFMFTHRTMKLIWSCWPKDWQLIPKLGRLVLASGISAWKLTTRIFWAQWKTVEIGHQRNQS